MPQYDQTWILFRWIVQELRKAQIGCDDAQAFLLANTSQDLIIGTLQGFLGHGCNFMAGLFQWFAPPWIGIFVQLESHYQELISIDRTRSRANMAAYSRQAPTSSRVRLG